MGIFLALFLYWVVQLVVSYFYDTVIPSRRDTFNDFAIVLAFCGFGPLCLAHHEIKRFWLRARDAKPRRIKEPPYDFSLGGPRQAPELGSWMPPEDRRQVWWAGG